eukprot:s6944_g4.t1
MHAFGLVIAMLQSHSVALWLKRIRLSACTHVSCSFLASRSHYMAMASFLLAFAAAVSATNAQETLRIAGSSTVYPVVNAWSQTAQMQASYNLIVEGGGSSTGARRVCVNRTDPTHVDIGDMSRNWRTSEALRLDDGYTLECLASKQRVTQIVVGIDGLAVVVAKNSAGHNCIVDPTMGGLTLAQLRWMFTDMTDAQLAAAGLDMTSVLPNDDGDGIKEWSDLSPQCEETPINIYGPGSASGTHDFFAEVVLDGFEDTENFPTCDHTLNQNLEALTVQTDIENFLQTQRPVNCYMESEIDEKILEWTLADYGGVAYFGFAYFAQNSATLTVARIAQDKVKGVKDTLDAKIEPSSYSITDGSYAVFRRSLYMNVDNEAWDRAQAFMQYGFTDAGQKSVSDVGYVSINANLRNQMEQRIAQKGNAQADYVPVAPEVCFNGTELFEEEYLNQFGNPKIRYSCNDCIPGYFKQLNTPTKCRKCQPGAVTSSAGQSACDFCLPGTFAEEGSTNCTACPKNYIAAAPGAGRCDACGSGYQTEDVGSSACVRCGLGKYRMTSDLACFSCPLGLTTAFMAAEKFEDCVCQADTYRSIFGTCEACPEGMTCAVGSDMANFYRENTTSYSIDRPYPQVKPGYYTTHDDPISVYKCLSENICLGGDPETCEGGRVNLVCSTCPPGEEWRGGKCTACTGSSGPFFLFLAGLAGCLGVTFMHVMTNWPLVKGNKTVMTAVYFCGMAATVVLTFGVYGTLNAVWGPPMSSFIPSFGILSLDMDFLSFSCVMGRKSFTAEYVFKLCAFPVLLLVVVTGSFLLQRVPRVKRYASFNRPAILNTAGFLMSALFVSVSLMSLEGFRCKANPNGKAILQAFGAMVCWEGGEHNTLMVLSVIAILCYPVTYLTFTGIASFGFGPLSVKYGLRFTSAVRFLSGRMKPDYVMFGFWWNVRNFMISLAPVIASNNYGGQIILLMAVFVLWLTGQAKSQCWRFELLNLLDMIVSGVQIMMLCLFGLLADDSIDRALVGWCIITIFVCVVLLLFAMASTKIVLHMRSKTHYDVFLTHHKAAAALSARHLKTLFNMCSTLNVFLDVDELDNLDNLSFAVKHTRKLLVMLTSDVLRRPWCAVEIGTAFLNKVPLGVLDINQDAVELSDKFITDVTESFSSADIGIFAKSGITVQDLDKAYRYLATLPRTRFQLSIPLVQMQLDSTLAAAGQELAAWMKKPKVVPLDPGKLVFIVFNTRDDAQCSVAFLLRHLFRQRRWDARLFCPGSEMMQRSKDGSFKLQDPSAAMDFGDILPVPDKAVAVVLMSKGLPFDPVALGAAATIKRAGLGALTVLSQESFWKPDEEYFDLLRSGSVLQPADLPVVSQIVPGYSLPELADALAPLYKILAWAVSPEQNQNLLRQEFSIIEERAAKELERRILKVEDRGSRASACFPPGASPTSSLVESPAQPPEEPNVSDVEEKQEGDVEEKPEVLCEEF